MNYPEFSELISNHDILCFTETKTDNVDCIEHEDFIFSAKNRSIFTHRRSGGIILGYKKSLARYIEVIPTSCKYVLWFKIHSSLLGLDDHLIVGIVYIPPAGSVYSSVEAFDELEAEFLNFDCEFNNICIMGDFNARTADHDVFIELRDLSTHEYELDDPRSG